ncbi:MAG: EthD family reductase [Acidobacteria bacterium]|nr:EthD family reductase [Acidobacteriota bacterium]MBI3425739.1 EthD family reductase [Acidobacteriota bacterium]
MIKFIVVVYRRADFSHAEFARYFREVHGPLAEQLPGLRKYVQNFVDDDPTRKPPGWDVVSELYFESRAAMEAAWATPAGEAATRDLENFADLGRTTWSVVEEIAVR